MNETSGDVTYYRNVMNPISGLDRNGIPQGIRREAEICVYLYLQTQGPHVRTVAKNDRGGGRRFGSKPRRIVSVGLADLLTCRAPPSVWASPRTPLSFPVGSPHPFECILDVKTWTQNARDRLGVAVTFKTLLREAAAPFVAALSGLPTIR